MPRKKKKKTPMPGGHDEVFVELSADHLRDRLALMKGVMPRKAICKDWSTYHFAVKPDGTATVAVASLDIRLLLKLDVLGAVGSGTLMIDALALDAMIGAYAEPRIRFHLDDPVKVRAEGIQTKLVLPGADPAKELKATAEGSLTTSGWMVRGADLAGALERTRPCTDPASTRYALGGVALVFPEAGEDGSYPGTMELVATDGRCLAIVRIACRPHGAGPVGRVRPHDDKDEHLPLLAGRAIPMALRLARLAGTGAVGLAVIPGATEDLPGDDHGPGLIQVVTRDAVLTSAIPDGRFPHFREVFPPAPPEAWFRLGDARRLGVLIETAVAGTDGESKGVEVTAAGGCVMMWTESETRGKAQIALTGVEMEGKATFTLDATMFRRFFAAADDGPMVLEFFGAKQALVLRSGEHYTFVIMPLTRDAPPPPAAPDEGEESEPDADGDGGVPVASDPEPVAPEPVTPDGHVVNGEAVPRRRRKR